MWEHKTEEPEQEERALGTIAARLHKPGEPAMAFTVTLGYRPAYDDVWQDGAEIVVDREAPQAVVYLIRHEHGADPLGEGPQAADSVRVWIPLDYDGDEFPTVDDVESHEWEALFGEATYTLQAMPIDFTLGLRSVKEKLAGIEANAGVPTTPVNETYRSTNPRVIVAWRQRSALLLFLLQHVAAERRVVVAVEVYKSLKSTL